MKKLMIATALLSSVNAMAGTMGPPPPKPLPWHFHAGIGYVNYEDMIDPNTTVLRIAGERDIFTYEDATFGIEVGAQTGLSSRLRMTETQLEAFGGTAIQATISTFFDVLGTVMIPFNLPVMDTASMTMNVLPETAAVFAKVGMAYRQMHLDRGIINEQSTINAEVQAGLSMPISRHASISLAYQGIYGGSTTLHVLTYSGVAPDATGRINSIPTQNGGLLMFTWNA